MTAKKILVTAPNGKERKKVAKILNDLVGNGNWKFSSINPELYTCPEVVIKKDLFTLSVERELKRAKVLENVFTGSFPFSY